MTKRKDKTYRKTVLSDGLIVHEGRKGEPTEYYEFLRDRFARIAYIAQKGSAGHWFVFKSWSGTKGRVVTLDSFPDKESAFNRAETACREGE